MADEQTCEVGSTLFPLAVGPYSDVRQKKKIRKTDDLRVILLCIMYNNFKAVA
jgi:hypothetical protein